MDEPRVSASHATPFSYDQAPVPHARSHDVSRRMRRYLINMGIRMACLLLMLVVPGPWKLLMFAGAVLIPMMAVLFANDQDLAGTPSDDDTVHLPHHSSSLQPEMHSGQITAAPTLTLLSDGTYAEVESQAPPASGNGRPQ